MTAETRILIVNADDFGQNQGINGGIIESHKLGIVTSASLMVRGEAATEAAEYASSNGRLSVGLHVDLGEWGCRQGEWWLRYQVVPLDDAVSVREEVYRQLDAFRRLVGRDPSHIDSHQHVHREEPVRAIVAELGHQLQVPVRHLTRTIRYCGRFYGQTKTGECVPEAVSASSLVRIIKSLPPGLTELACHPGYAEGLQSDYKDERVLEILALCAPEVRAALLSQTVQLESFCSLEF
jgi:predicted glycoside hydrolase/deacetylase ChbG (UPF0249 family)